MIDEMRNGRMPTDTLQAELDARMHKPAPATNDEILEALAELKRAEQEVMFAETRRGQAREAYVTLFNRWAPEGK